MNTNKQKEIDLIEIYVNSICNVDRSYNYFEGEKRTEYSMKGCVYIIDRVTLVIVPRATK